MKKILVSAAGTANAFHLAELAHTQFKDSLELYLCDINPPHLVASAHFARKYFTVPLAADPSFKPTLLDILAKERVDIYVPLIDRDIYTFPSDLPELKALGVRSSAPNSKAGTLLKSKRKIGDFLQSKGICVPKALQWNEVLAAEPSAKYFVKPDDGWGSLGAEVMTVQQIKLLKEQGAGLIIQELCQFPELTVEVYNGKGGVRAICRERLETKCGVCTKARVWQNPEMTALSRKLCEVIEMPVSFCFQVMKNSTGAWAITDLNPRLGAGTSLSTTCDWSLAAATLINLADLPMDPLPLLTNFEGDRFVVRAHRDIRTK